MKRLRVISLLFLLCVLAFPVLAAEDFSDGLLNQETVIEAAHGITREVYPNADSVLVDEHVRVRYQSNGTSQTWDDEYIKVLTEKGKRERRTISLHYTLPYGTAVVKKLEVIKPDGTAHPIDVERQSREMVDRSQMNANIYNPNAKILRIAVPGLEIGDICHIVSYRDTVKPRVPETWSDFSVFEYTVPFKHLVYEVFGPKELPLRNIKIGDEIADTVTYTSDGDDHGNHYRWEIHDVPRMFTEPRMPPTWNVVQRLLVSTIQDWEHISRWYWNLSKPHLDAAVPEMQTKVDELIDTVTGQQERTERLFTFVSQEIRYMGITTETEAPGYEPHDVRVTFKNRYGVCRDKAALLVAMLRMANIPAYPVLIHTGPRKDEDVPQPFFNHAIVATENGDGGYILMDPTDENTVELLPAYLGNKSYLVAHPEGETLLTSAVDPATNNLMRIHSKGSIDEYGTLTVTSTLHFDGINDNGYRGYFSQIKPIERKRYFEGRIKSRIAGARITEFQIVPADMQDTTVPLQVHFSYEAENYPLDGDTYTMLSLPWLGTRIGYVNFVLGNTGLATRKYPLMTRIACGVEESFEIDLGPGVGDVVSLPDYAAIETNTLSFVPRVTVVSNTLTGSGTFLLKAVEFTPAEYLVLKQALKDIEYAQRKQPVFEVADPPDSHDIRILRDDLLIELDDARNWTRTRTVKKEILTYAGKKKHSELKFNYNPIWTEVEIASATVSNLDGTVHSVVEEEKNLMDAGWVGSAPRYPAEKTMVVSLPGVELGSIIEYRVVQRMKDMPFFSLTHSFRSFEPIESGTLVITAPASLPLTVIDRTGRRVTARSSERIDRIIREWSSSAQPAVPREDSLPPWWSFNPTVFVSAGDWKQYSHSVEEALMHAASEQTKTAQQASQLAGDESDTEQQVVAIRDFVARTIKPTGPSLPSLPLESITPADRVLAEGYGNTTDRAVVLYTMLQELGLAPRFLLVSSWAPGLTELYADLVAAGQRNLFDEVLVCIDLNDRTVTLNDSDQYGQLGTTPFDGKPTLSLDGKIETLHASEDMREQSTADYRIDLAPDGDALMTVSTRYFGTAYSQFQKRFTELSPEERKRFFLEMVAGVSQAAKAAGELITDYETYPGRRAFTVHLPRYAVRSGKYLYLTLPNGAPSLLPVRADHRKGPLYHDQDVRGSTHYEIVLPDGVKQIEIIPHGREWDGPSGLGKILLTAQLRQTSLGTQVIDVVRTVDLKETVIAPEDYSALLTADRRIKHPASRTLLIRLE